MNKILPIIFICLSSCAVDDSFAPEFGGSGQNQFAPEFGGSGQNQTDQFTTQKLADCNLDGIMETDLFADVTNCGLCGNQCYTFTEEVGCVLGTCSILKCRDYFENCNGLVDDGCETNLSSPEHCGRCDNTCFGLGALCSAGFCYVKCPYATGDCDHNKSNGCETSLTTNQNCGECGKICGFNKHCANLAGEIKCISF